MKAKLCIFDMDGLLVDTEKIYYEASRYVSDKYNYQIPDNLIYGTMGSTYESALVKFEEVMGKDFDTEYFFKQMRERQVEIKAMEPVKPKKGAHELLDYLRSHGYKTCISTSSNMKRVEEYLIPNNLIDKFDYIKTGDTVEHSKPDPEIFLETAEYFGYQPNQCVVYEDSFNGILAAYNGGFICVHIPDRCLVPEDIKKLANYVYESLDKSIELYEKGIL